MCDHDTKAILPPADAITATMVAAAGSRRKRLWDLSHDCHCPLIGVCLPLAVLRKLVNKSMGGEVMASDYEIHVGTVSECTRRSRLTEMLQRELDRRYAAALHKFKSAKTIPAVARLWAEAVECGDLAGAFWAALTHPVCDAKLHETLCRDIHMIQHQAGACMRADAAKLEAVSKGNAALQAELSKMQERHGRMLAEKNAEILRLGASLMRVQANAVSKDTVIASLQADLAELQSTVPDLDARIHLKEKNTLLANRQQAMKAEMADLKEELAATLQRLERAEKALAESSMLAVQAVTLPQASEPASSPVQLHAKNVLCVGGRTASLTTYRTLIERVGGRFLHHDGGLEDSPGMLDASLAAADLVICQAGCIGHNAYWRVKDFCKRTGKQCVYVDNPSASSFVKGLQSIAPGTSGLETVGDGANGPGHKD